MRFALSFVIAAFATLCSCLSAQAEPSNSTTATPTQSAQQATVSDRIPHPVVYLNDASERAAAQAARIQHPVVYLSTPTTAAPTDSERIPHPVVYLDQAQPTATPKAVTAPPNPDFDANGTVTPTPVPSPTAPTDVATPPTPSPASKALAGLIDDKSLVDLDEAQWTGLAQVYGTRNFEPVWVSPRGLTSAGRQLITALQKADEWGLDPRAFSIPEIADARQDSNSLRAETRAELELRLASAALTYASHARGGRILNPTEQLSSYLDRKPQLKDPGTVLQQLAAASDPSIVLHGLHPKHPQFEQLRQKVLELRASADRFDIVRIPRGALLRQGSKDPHVALLRKRLEIAPIPPEDGTAFDPEIFDNGVLEAVLAFQKEHGLSVDGLVGNGTRRALNDIAVPDPEKLIANMEQWRWMPDDLGDAYVWVNIPEFKVRFIRDGKVVHTERIIAGKTNQQTPVFSDELETLYFHPKWHVPQSIKVNEIYPSLARGGSYFRRQGLRIAYNGRLVNPDSIDWSTRDIRKYHVYQPSGRSNVLGVVKFTFPNKHQVYLHDTPTKHLFKNKMRMYSHGCIRVRNPVRLAEVIVEAANGLSSSDVAKILNGPVRETPVKLDHMIPVHVTYFTAWVDEDGKEQAAKDIYGHERKITLALAGRFDQIVVGRDHLAPVKFKPRNVYSGPNVLQDFLNSLFPGF